MYAISAGAQGVGILRNRCIGVTATEDAQRCMLNADRSVVHPKMACALEQNKKNCHNNLRQNLLNGVSVKCKTN